MSETKRDVDRPAAGSAPGKPGRPPMSAGRRERVTVTLTAAHLACLDHLREVWGLGGASVSAVMRMALELATEVKPETRQPGGLGRLSLGELGAPVPEPGACPPEGPSPDAPIPAARLPLEE